MDEINADFNTADYTYEVFEVNEKDEQAIPRKWAEIWQEEEAGKLNRSYKIDFERYDSHQNVAIFTAKK